MPAKTNLLSETRFVRLKDSIQWSQRQFDFQRKKRYEAIQQFVGGHYAENGAQRPVPTNFLKMAVVIYVRLLAPHSPRAIASTQRADLRPTAANLELAINQIPEEIGLDESLRKFVTESIFSPFGVVKIGLHKVGKVLGHDYGETFVDPVTFDDYFLDCSAKDPSQIQYEGNDYWLDFEEVKESGWLDGEATRDVKADDHSVIGPNGEQRAEGIGVDNSAKTFKDRIHLRDVWLPDEGLLVTYGVTSGKLFNVVEWDGPKGGPYIKMGFTDVPGLLLPLPPVAVWRDLHELGNALFRKLANQADGQKSVLGFSGGNDDAVEDFKKARDGDGIKYSGPEPKELRAGGVEAKTLAFYLQCRDLYSYFASNLDSLGGLSPQAQTVGQERLLSEAAGAQLRDMAVTTVSAIRKIFRALGWYEWNDPVKRRVLEKPIPGTTLKIPVPWGRESKRDDFSLFNLDIDVYSLQDNSPGVKLQKLGAIVREYVVPLAPLIQQQGGEIDVQAILRDVAKYAAMPEVAEYVTWTDRPASEQAEAPARPAQTTRTYERVGRPGATREGASAAIQQLLLGGDPGGDSRSGN